MSTSVPSSTAEERHQHGLELFRSGKYNEAARAFTEALQTRETSELWNDWATAQMMCEQVAESERGYRRALELDPKHARATGNLGVLLARVGRTAEAEPLLERAANASVGTERDELLKLLAALRDRVPFPFNSDSVSSAHFLQHLASVVHLQSQVIARLGQRLNALETKILESPASSAKTEVGGEKRESRTRKAEEKRLKNRFDEKASLLPAVCASLPNQTDAGGKMTALSSAVAQESGAAFAPTAPLQEVSAAPAPTKEPQPGILFNAIVYGGSGYAEGAWMVILGLEDRGFPLQLLPAGESTDTAKVIPEPYRKRLENLQQQCVDIPRSIILQSGPAWNWDPTLTGRLRVGHTMFETDRLPRQFLEPCLAADEVWVPTRFNMEVFAASGVPESKLCLLPLGVDTKTFRPNLTPLEIPQKRSFTFVSVFDWILRKGYDVLLRAYLREFRADEDVALILKVYQLAFSFGDLEAIIRHFIERTVGLHLENSPPIILVNGFLSQENMARLYSSCDAFVLPTRGEGYGRPYLEALASGLPVIATNWGGQMDFLTPQNSYLIESRPVPVSKDVEVEEMYGCVWAEPNVDHLRQLMREVFSQRDSARAKAEVGRREILSKYDWSVIVPQWVDQFERLM